MTDMAAFVGDVHGNLRALTGLYRRLVERGIANTIFLGDYLNKGWESSEVLAFLLDLADSGRATLLKGNHEQALLDVFDTGDLTPFLKMGGAATIRSYVGPVVGPDVLSDLKAVFPETHLLALQCMMTTYETEDVVARHAPSRGPIRKFEITAHIPVGDVPLISTSRAQLDTGCGSGEGRLTALVWPSREVIQVDAAGAVVP